MFNVAQKEYFEQFGFLIFDSLFSAADMHKLKQAANKIVEEFDPSIKQSIFSTKHENTHRDDYFLSSGDKVRCFFEEEAFAADGSLQQDKHLSINKIGHALHAQIPEFMAFSQAKVIANIAEFVGVVEPEIRQSMYIFKQPKIGGEIRWHQDASYFYTQPQSVVTFWFAIEDATLLNGCLQVHTKGANFPLKEQFKRYPNDQTQLVQLQDVSWPPEHEAMPLEVKAGTLIVFNGVLPHFSQANRSDKSRHAYTLHITSAQSVYSAENWLQAEPVKIYP